MVKFLVEPADHFAKVVGLAFGFLQSRSANDRNCPGTLKCLTEDFNLIDRSKTRFSQRRAKGFEHDRVSILVMIEQLDVSPSMGRLK